MNLEELKPCPFCGSGVLHKNNPEKMGRTFFVSCGFCDCRGACLPTEQGAVDAWNTRAAALPAKLEAAQRLRDAAEPFCKIAEGTMGRIPTERLSGANYHELWKSVAAFDKEQQ